MKQVIVLVAFFFVTNIMFAQFGITGRYHFNNAPDWVPFSEKNATDPYQYLGDGLSVGIDYWLRLKNYRIEFMPELNYSQYKQNEQFNQNANYQYSYDRITHSNRFYSFFLNTNFYPFDFLGDCNCPTFSKQGQLLKKGFFLQVSPGISYLQNTVTFVPIEKVVSNDWAVSVGAGVGLDIGLSDVVTLTPLVSLRYFPNATWTYLNSSPLEGVNDFYSNESPIWQWSVGARLGFRFDYKSKNRRR